HATTFDFDGDGATNEGEYLAGTIVTDSLSVFRVTSLLRSGNTLTLTFPSVAGRRYTYEGSEDLLHWTPVTGPGIPDLGTGSAISQDFDTTGFPKYFVRPRVGP
ncbi:MAG: hypothetical protein ABIZ56_05755, partial [Chthoniobacteraceae bacterium]